jgi:hypothetical protein
MEPYNRGSHTAWDCKVPLGVDDEVELLREMASAHETVIHAGAVNRDQVHMQHLWGSGILGCEQRKRDRQSLGRVHKEPDAP